MSNAKDIRGKIKSVKNTQKITKAMEMVAASKMRRAQDHMQEGRPYAANIVRVMSHLLQSSSEISHPFLNHQADNKRIGYILISTDRGLCGGLNINLFKKLLEHLKKDQQEERELSFSVFGRKGLGFLSRLKSNVVSAQENYGDHPALHELIATVQPMLDAYLTGKLDRVYLVSNRFVNTMTQEPTVTQLLPVQLGANDSPVKEHQWDYVYEPNAQEILSALAIRYVESLIKQAVAENIACEMSARMIAMKSASDNAGSLISDLQLQYNKARQAAITQELSEIVGGAAAV